MSLNIKALSKPSSGTYAKAERIPEGTYPARLVQMASLGIQEYEWQGETKLAPKIQLTFELPTETITINDEEQPRWISKEFNLSLHEKSSLTPIVKALDPKGECQDLSDLLGKPCMVQVGSTSTGNAKITNVVAPMRGMPVAEIYNPAKMLAFDFDNPDLNVLAQFPNFIQEKIKSATNYNGFADGVQAKPVSKPAMAKAKPSAYEDKQRQVQGVPAFDEDEGDDLPF